MQAAWTSSLSRANWLEIVVASAVFAGAAGAAPIESLSPAQLELQRRQQATRAELPGYQDRFMNLGEQSQLGVAADEGPAAAEPQGQRFWSLETRAGGTSVSASHGPGYRQSEGGLRTEYRQETLNHGEWVLQADGRASGGDTGIGLGGGWWGSARERSSLRLTLRNQGLPVGGAWLADSRLGDGYSDITVGLARGQRLMLSTTIVRGGSALLYSGGTELRVGWGERGELAGGPYPGFESTQGQLGWLGGTRPWGDRGYVAAQLGLARGIPQAYSGWSPESGVGRQDVTTWALALGQGKAYAMNDQAWRWRATWLGSHRQAQGGVLGASDAQGLYVEAGRKFGQYTHEFGAHFARPDLYFSDQRLFGGTRGVNWRTDFSARRLNWGVGVDYEREAASTDALYGGYWRTTLTANLQYALDRTDSFGGSIALAKGLYGSSTPGLPDPANRSAYGYAFYQTRLGDWPRTRLSLTARLNQQLVLDSETATGQELQWEQDWLAESDNAQRAELTTTLGYGWDRSSDQTRRYPTAGLRFRYGLGGRGYLAGNLRYTSSQGNLSTTRGLAGNISAEYPLRDGWRLGLMVSLNEARSAAMAVPSFAPSVYRTQERSAYLTLRWEARAGQPFTVVGHRESPGSGSIQGRVFLDSNGDGRRQTDEAGAASVEVVLGGRYRALTDAQGQFEFPAVATGAQQLTISLNSVPLPWTLPTEAGTSVYVPLRGTALVDLPLTRFPMHKEVDKQ